MWIVTVFSFCSYNWKNKKTQNKQLHSRNIQKTVCKYFFIETKIWKKALCAAGLSFVKKQLHSKNWRAIFISAFFFAYIHRHHTHSLLLFSPLQRSRKYLHKSRYHLILLIWWDWIVIPPLTKLVLPCCWDSIGSHCLIRGNMNSAGGRKTIKSISVSQEDSSQFRQISRLGYYNRVYSAKTRSGKF